VTSHLSFDIFIGVHKIVFIHVFIDGMIFLFLIIFIHTRWLKLFFTQMLGDVLGSCFLDGLKPPTTCSIKTVSMMSWSP